MKKQKGYILNEIEKTEKSYTDKLYLLIQLQKKLVSDKIITPEEANTLFSNIS